MPRLGCMYVATGLKISYIVEGILLAMCLEAILLCWTTHQFGRYLNGQRYLPNEEIMSKLKVEST